MTEENHNDSSAEIVTALFIANLLFVIFLGIPYLLIWLLYTRQYKFASPITQNHLKQALIASSISTAIVIAVVVTVLMTGGFMAFSRPAMLAAEFYGVVVVPAFTAIGIFAYRKAVRGENYKYPLIHRWANLNAV